MLPKKVIGGEGIPVVVVASKRLCGVWNAT